MLQRALMTAVAVILLTEFPLAKGQSDDEQAVQSQQSMRPELVAQLGHFYPVISVTFSPNGRWVLTGSEDNTVRLWEATTGREIRHFQGHTKGVSTVAFSPDGKQILTTSKISDNTARLWEAATGKELQVLRGHSGPVSSAAFSPDGRRVLTGGQDQTARLWEVATDKEPKVSRGYSGPVWSVTFSPDGPRAMTVGQDGVVRLWEAATGKELQVFRGHSGRVRSVAFSPDGRRVLTGGEDKTARLWEAATGKELQVFRGHSGLVWSVAFSPDGRRVLTGGEDKTARLWEAATGKGLQVFQAHSGWVSSVAFSPDGHQVLAGVSDNTARLWEAATGKELQVFRAYSALVSSVAFSPDGRQVLIGSRDNTARLWEVATGKEIGRFRGHSGPVSSVAFSPDGRQVLTGSWDETARLWEVDTGKESKIFRGHPNGVTSVAFSPDGHLALTGGQDDMVRLWEVATGKEHGSFPGDQLLVSSVAFSPDGRQVLTGGADKTARLREVDTGKELQVFRGHSESVESVAFSRDGCWALTGSPDQTARLWKVATGKELQVFQGHSGPVWSVAFSPDGHQVLTGGADKTARLWKVATGKELQVFRGHSGPVWSVAFSPDGRQVLTGSSDGSAGLWKSDVATGKERRGPQCRLMNFRDSYWMVVDPEGRFDGNNLENFQGANWVFPDDPFRPLPPEIFMRDYYEPRLLARTLAKEIFKPVRPLSELNRVQPSVRVAGVAPGGEPDVARVTVEVAGAEGGGRLLRTGVYDLRLFRDGHLVGRWPEPAGLEAAAEPDLTSREQMDEWRSVNRIVLDTKTGRATRTFTVRLPHREKAGPVEFTAYAFNEDRVKSLTATARFEAPANPPTGRPRAYLIAMGVSATKSPTWDLAFAAADARLMAGALGEALTKAGRYEVVPVLLTSERADDGTVATATATKANLHAVLDLLAGRPVDDRVRGLLPGGDQLRAATPDDLVLLTFSGHGYTDARGALYLLPYDVGERRERVEDILDKCISTSELSAWLRHVDAGELALVVDACHSAAAVRQPGFKWGPLGSPGLGQLAYDKGMRVLAGSQADDVAVESARIQQGLLTYALVKDGLEQRRAAREEVVTLGGLLTYAVKRVPRLYREVLSGEVKDAAGAAARNVGAVSPKAGQPSAEQRPDLFDDKSKSDVVLSRQKADE